MVDTADHKPLHDPAGEGHHPLVARPPSEDEGPIAEAEQRAAQLRTNEHPLGARGLRFDRGSVFYVGLMASAGVAVTYLALRVLAAMSSALVLIGVAFFVALGLEPAVSRLVNRKLPRWAAVTLVLVVVFAIVAGSVAAAIPPLAQTTRPIHRARPALHPGRQTTPRRSAGSTNASICKSGSQTRSTGWADPHLPAWSRPERRCSAPCPTW